MRLAAGNADCFGIVAVIFLTASRERLDELRTDDFDRVAVISKFARPVKCACAGFDDDGAGVQSGKLYEGVGCASHGV